MKRLQALQVLRAAGAQNDRATWLRIYVENRISFAAAQQEWRAGQRFAAFIAARDQSTQQGKTP